MNERIRELAEQAGITTNLDTDYYEKDMNKWVDYFTEKFAELIIRECAELCDGFQAREVGMKPAECAGAIRKMFGFAE